MGHGASTGSVGQTTYPKVFVDDQLVEGGILLRDDVNFATSFVEYLKSGLWLDRLKSYQVQENSADKENLYDFMLSEYKISAAQLNDLDKVNWRKAQPEKNLVSFRSTTGTSSKKYDMSENCTCFSDTQLCCIMMSIVHPIYMANPSHQRLVKYGGCDNNDSCSESTNPANLMALDEGSQSQRAQLTFMSSAMLFDASDLLQLVKGDWVDQVSATYDQHPLAMSVVNTAQNGHPFVYANRAFEQLFGYSAGGVYGKPLSSLQGAATERAQQADLKEALKKEMPTKLAITHYTTQKLALLDLVAVRAVGAFAVLVHFPPGRGARLENLLMVDDFMLLVPYVLHAPPVQLVRQSWLSALASPKSVRSSTLSPTGPGAKVNRLGSKDRGGSNRLGSKDCRPGSKDRGGSAVLRNALLAGLNKVAMDATNRNSGRSTHGGGGDSSCPTGIAGLAVETYFDTTTAEGTSTASLTPVERFDKSDRIERVATLDTLAVGSEPALSPVPQKTDGDHSNKMFCLDSQKSVLGAAAMTVHDLE